MKRRIAIVLIFLLLGAIVNIAVAWGCALWAPIPKPSLMEFPKQVPSDIAASVPADWLEMRPEVSFISMFRRDTSSFACQIVQFGVAEAILGADQMGPGRVLHVERLGWPMLTVQCEGRLDWRHVRGGTPMTPLWSGGFAGPSSWKWRVAPYFMFPPYLRPIPFLPIWPGFAVNTLFYAAILWLLFALPRALRRWRRLKRGLCPACAYPVGASDLCTECGRPVTRRLQGNSATS